VTKKFPQRAKASIRLSAQGSFARGSIVRAYGSPPIKLRTRGPRSFEEIPPSELQVVAKQLLQSHKLAPGSDDHLRAVLEWFDLKRLTTQVGTTLREVMERSFPHVDEFLSSVRTQGVRPSHE